MNNHKHKERSGSDLGSLADDARALMSATVDVAGERVGEARRRLSVALENVGDKAVQRAKAIDGAVHERPYHAIAIGVGLGTLVGYMLARRSSNGNGE